MLKLDCKLANISKDRNIVMHFFCATYGNLVGSIDGGSVLCENKRNGALANNP